MLDAKNSARELSIEKYLTKSEEAFFGKVRKDKLSSAASIISSQRESVWGTPSPSIYSRPDCKFIFGCFYDSCIHHLDQHPARMYSRTQNMMAIFKMILLSLTWFP